MKLRLTLHAPLKNKKVLLRADFDAAIENGVIKEDFRIKEVVPTLKFILKRGGQLRLMAHLGRPRGQKTASLSLRSVADYLSRLLRRKVVLISDPLSEKLFECYCGSSHVLLFENLRFWPGEEKNDSIFAKKLARWGDLYVNEAFANSHRSHASMSAITKFLPSYAGLRLYEEVEVLEKVLQNPKRPLVTILGGAKLETKMFLVERMLKEADRLLMGGELANTFFSQIGFETGKSVIAKEVKISPKVLDSRKLYLPVDVATSSALVSGRSVKIRRADKVGINELIADIGPESLHLFTTLLKDAKTIIWNGPLGVAEIPEFAKGTVGLARVLAKSKAFKVLGGGDSIAILHKYKLLKAFTFVSTGGGAMLEFLSGKKLLPLEALRKF